MMSSLEMERAYCYSPAQGTIPTTKPTAFNHLFYISCLFCHLLLQETKTALLLLLVCIQFRLLTRSLTPHSKLSSKTDSLVETASVTADALVSRLLIQLLHVHFHTSLVTSVTVQLLQLAVAYWEFKREGSSSHQMSYFTNLCPMHVTFE